MFYKILAVKAYSNMASVYKESRFDVNGAYNGENICERQNTRRSIQISIRLKP